MRIITFSPFATGLRLKASVDPRSPYYARALRAVPTDDPELTAPNRERDGAREAYAKLDEDDYDLRLAVFSPEGATADFHVFQNGIAIAQTEAVFRGELTGGAVEAFAQDAARKAMADHCPALMQRLNAIREGVPPRLLDVKMVTAPDADAPEPEDPCEDTTAAWIARAIVLEPGDLEREGVEALVTAWLKDTARPDDAKAIMDGELDHSMTWLNYVIVEREGAQTESLASVMRVAQAFYAAQDALNDQTQTTLATTYFMSDVRDAERLLLDARAQMRMLRIQYDVQKALMSRTRQRELLALMDVWDFEVLVENGTRLIEASSARIDEITTKRSERGTLITDLILASIGLLTVVEVSLYLTEYSREVMSRPALGYTDSNISWILSAVAGVDTDRMLIGGALSVMVLVLLYAYWKLRK